ncbi:MAG: hypothetical protein HRU69_01175 [Flammeovirgaceae bacterium]|nr:MAG: hypothetical protein HRU69_01175 [Flammeovirgaceae bacterium]
MDSKRADELLKKYWDCQTSLDEEKELREYFRQTDVPEDLAPAASLFRYFDEQKTNSLNDDFDQLVIGRMTQTRKSGTPGIKTLFTYSIRIAAGVAVLVVAVFLVRQELQRADGVAANADLVDTYDDPQKAFEETKKALEMISRGFVRAEQQAKKINVFNEAQEKIQNQLKKEAEL